MASTIVRVLHRADRPAQEVVDAVYGELERLCAKTGARMVIVILDKVVPSGERETLNTQSAAIADAHTALVTRIPDGPIAHRNMMYQWQYGHWRGEPPVMVDDHPNRLAHEIITQEIIAALERQASARALASRLKRQERRLEIPSPKPFPFSIPHR